MDKQSPSLQVSSCDRCLWFELSGDVTSEATLAAKITNPTLCPKCNEYVQLKASNFVLRPIATPIGSPQLFQITGLAF